MLMLCILVFASSIVDITCQLDFEPQIWDERKNYVAFIPSFNDDFYDRIVGVAINYTDSVRNISKPAITTGVFISENQTLTSFNPFRLLAKNAFPLINIQHISDDYEYSRANTSYTRLDFEYLTCARQVIPGDDDIPDHMKHGPHRPLHDLMVMKFRRMIDLRDGPDWYIRVPILTKLADPYEELGDTISIVSLGHVNNLHVREHRYLNKFDLNIIEQNIVVDCEEWFPRQWGYFICILNVHNFVGIGSGGMLFSKSKLFGVGSFALFKGRTGILVFTDVRPYYDHIYKACGFNETMSLLSK